MRLVSVVAAALMMILNGTALAQQAELVDRTYSGVSKETNPQVAKRVIQDEASQKVSEEIIQELIGNDRFLKNKTLIQNKIIRNSARYIPFTKPSALTQNADEFKMSVAMKVSLKDLKQMLQDNSLLNENEAVPVVLPLVSWQDRVEGRSYRWWLPLDKNPQGFLVKEGRLLEEALRGAFQKNNFYLIKPIEAGLAASVPADFQNEKIGGEDAQFFAQYFNAPVVVDGQVNLTKGERNNFRIEIKMTALQVSNGRAIADVSRRFDTDSGSFENAIDKKLREVLEGTANDLAVQVMDAWQRGSLGTSMIRLTIQGRQPLPVLEGMKEKIRSQLTQVKNIRERLVSADSVSFEVDTSVPASELVGKLESLDLDGKRLSRVSEGQNEIVLKWAQ
ncbi:hypothetical protein AB1A81_09510 [Bdellovibrio bacteriovorus]|uniref:DUF2066 domain-containing protein n=1 Tax=Bdellovibrio bacteriovorus (strain ATCC 15356 / DSM 50701 / NCIMB 9529 / HD100) TaxID=264462 RepID=Q6MLD5_BDEBA|nr:hypothetical protein [Bdellovibrio bacteriovorus]AHZ84568.1 hypothetical protein EP01_06410 [Bdellovibrio bacteriovorus]BEV68457.1 hypothetical protein Bb109J_c1877 [Bdellovibrio bacteriovorus]CAE79922.1 hypothetical protein predicted by Glimmer/Critica [Bdellovibrio bacteriovorus HD100]